MEAMQLATNFILASGLRNPKVLSRQDTPIAFASFGAAWKSDEAVGAVKIVPPDGGQINGLDVATAIAADNSRSCKAKFASGRVSELIDSEVVFRSFSSCDDLRWNENGSVFCRSPQGRRICRFLGSVTWTLLRERITFDVGGESSSLSKGGSKRE